MSILYYTVGKHALCEYKVIVDVRNILAAVKKKPLGTIHHAAREAGI